MSKKNGALFVEPNATQRALANDARAAVRAQRWDYIFHPFLPYGERVELRDPGNAGRLSQETRALWRRASLFVEVLTERRYAVQRWQKKTTGRPAYVATDASTFLSRALELFPGSRIQF